MTSQFKKGDKVRIKDNLPEVLTELGFDCPHATDPLIGTMQTVYDVWFDGEQPYLTVDLCVEIPEQCCELHDSLRLSSGIALHLLEEPKVTTHIVGVEIVVQGRWLRQVCSWCGKVLTDYDLANMASSDGKSINGWQVGVLVDVSGINPVCMSVNDHEDGKLPDTFCGAMETFGKRL